MKKKLILILLLVLALLGAWYYYRLHRPAPQAASLLPSSTLVFLQAPALAASQAEFANTPARRLWQEEEVQRFVAPALAAWRKALDPQEQWNEKLLQRVHDLLHGEVFLAVTRLSLLGGFHAGIVFGADVGPNQIQAKLALNHFRSRIDKYNPQNQTETKRYLGVDYVVLPRMGKIQIHYTMLGALVVATTAEDTMRDVIARHTGNADPAAGNLASNPTFEEFRAAMPDGHELLGFVNLEPVMGLLGPLALMTSGAGGGDSLKSLAGLRGTGVSVTFEPSLIREVRLTLYRPEGHQPDPPVTDDTLAFTTPDTLLYRVGAFDFANTYEMLLQVAAQANLPALAAALQTIERRLLRLKLDPREDVLGQLGPQTALTLQWREGSSLPELALVTAVREADQARGALDEFMNALKDATAGPNTPWDESAFRGHRLRTVPLNTSKVAPTYAVVGNYLLVALGPDFARELIGQFENADAPRLSANTTYRETMERLPGQGSSYSYCDLPALYPHLAAMAQRSLTRDGPNPYLDLEALPSTAAVIDYLAPFSAATVATAERVTTTCYSPFGSPVALLAWAAGGHLMSSPFSMTLGGGQPTVNAPVPTTTSSGTPVPPVPPENQTAGSQTPSSAPTDPAP